MLVAQERTDDGDAVLEQRQRLLMATQRREADAQPTRLGGWEQGGRS